MCAPRKNIDPCGTRARALSQPRYQWAILAPQNCIINWASITHYFFNFSDFSSPRIWKDVSAEVADTSFHIQGDVLFIFKLACNRGPIYTVLASQGFHVRCITDRWRHFWRHFSLTVRYDIFYFNIMFKVILSYKYSISIFCEYCAWRVEYHNYSISTGYDSINIWQRRYISKKIICKGTTCSLK